MTAWKKVRNLFWQGGEQGAPAAGGAGGEGELSDEEFAAMLSGSPHAEPQGGAEPDDASTVQMSAMRLAGWRSTFRRNTTRREFEHRRGRELENFIARLDQSLPQASKIAAAQAFLGAIGKDKAAVFGDAERKIMRVRGIAQAKGRETRAAMRRRQAQIAELRRRSRRAPAARRGTDRHLEAVRSACLVEESAAGFARVLRQRGARGCAGQGALAAEGWVELVTAARHELRRRKGQSWVSSAASGTSSRVSSGRGRGA
jgi:hypothetical protein